MRVMQMVVHINTYKGYGVTMDQLKKNLTEVEEEDIKRLITSALELGEIKRMGVGRGQKYYGIDFEPIVSEKVTKSVNEHDLIDGKIDVSKCLNVKEKIDTILASSHNLSQPIMFEYRERLLETPTNRELRDFINDGVAEIVVKLYYDTLKKKNVIYSKQVKPKYNSLNIGKHEGKIVVEKHIGGTSFSAEKDIVSFDNWAAFEKYLRTLLGK